MLGILINPFDQTVEPVDYSGDFQDIYKLTDCSTFTISHIDQDNDLFLDDEGLYSKGDNQRYFTIGNQTFAGKGLVLGHDGNGETIEWTGVLSHDNYRNCPSVNGLTITWKPEEYNPEPRAKDIIHFVETMLNN